MRYLIAADVVLLSHFAFITFAVFGAVLVAFKPGLLWVHLPVVIWSSIVNLASWKCPLTPLEQALRLRAGQSGYSGGFVQHYIGNVVYPRGMPRQMELVAGVSILAWNMVIYGVVFAWMK